jgi:hypothetical protein
VAAKMSDGNNHYMEELAEVITRRVLRKYSWLIDLSRRHKISLILFQDIMDFLEEFPNLEKEEEPVSVGLTLKNAKTVLNEPFMNRTPFHISLYSNFADFKNAIDGNMLCYIVDEKGMVSIGQIPQELLKGNPRLTLLNLSSVFQTIAFHLYGSRSEIYDLGKIIRINRKGIWLIPCLMPLNDFENEGFPLNTLKLVFQLCEKMSELNKGGIFVITKADTPKFISPMIRNYNFRKCAIDQMNPNQVVELASIDGAVILNTKGEMVNIGQKLEAPPSTDCCKESGRGTKHNSALIYSKAVDCVIFVISQEGPISLYFKGALYARCFGELFGNQ